MRVVCTGALAVQTLGWHVEIAVGGIVMVPGTVEMTFIKLFDTYSADETGRTDCREVPFGGANVKSAKSKVGTAGLFSKTSQLMSCN